MSDSILGEEIFVKEKTFTVVWAVIERENVGKVKLHVESHHKQINK